MKAILFSIIIFVSASVFCQWENQIPNYSFEKHDLTNWNADINCGNNPEIVGLFGSQYQYIKDYWSVINEWTHPLKRTICLNKPPVATADIYHESCRGTNNARSGNTWGYTNGEYLVVPTKNYLNGGLKSNKTYFLEVFQRGAGDSELNIIAFKNQPVVCSYNKRIELYNANKEHDVLLSFDASSTLGWTRYRAYFSIYNDKKWLSFGNSGEWDDIRIYEVQPNKCRENWYFDNTVFNYPMEVFQVSGKVYLRNGVDPENGSNHILGNVIQYANSKVVLRGGNRFKI